MSRGRPGELCTRGYSVMLGYWDEPERTAEVVDAARWMHTGDLGMMDADGGEELCAWVTLREGAADLTVDDLKAFAAGQLAHYKIPRYVLVVETFPMTVTGKIRKVEMRAESVRLLGLGSADGRALPERARSDP